MNKEFDITTSSDNLFLHRIISLPNDRMFMIGGSVDP